MWDQVLARGTLWRAFRVSVLFARDAHLSLFLRPQVTMSQDLTWMLIKRGNSFIRKSHGITLTAEPNNVTNQHSYKFSGLANKRAVGVSVVETGDDSKKVRKIQLSIKRVKAAYRNKPTKLYADQLLTKHRVNGNCAGARAIKKATKGNYYRADLTKYALTRYHRLQKSLRKPKKVATRRRGRNAN